MSSAREQRIEGRAPGKVGTWVPKWRGVLNFFPVTDFPNLPLIGKRGVRAKSCPGVGGGRNNMFSGSRLISAPGVPGAWRQEPGLSSAPLFPQCLSRIGGGSGLGALLPCPPQFAPFNRTRRGGIKILEWANVLQPSSRGFEARGRGTRHSPGQESHHLSRPHPEAGLACSTRNAGWGPGARGTFQGRPRAPGASLRNSTLS